MNRFSSAPRVQFDVASTFDNETAIVKREDLWGVIDKEGKFIIRPQFFQIQDGYFFRVNLFCIFHIFFQLFELEISMHT